VPRIFTGSPWQRFKQRWEDCSLCDLCRVRKNIVLCKGNIPCDVLFIGEAPGPSEDITGVPFDGPAGALLHKQIDEALVNSGQGELKIGFTNLVCCIPKAEKGDKFKEPPKESIEACNERLTQFVELCGPRLIVLVGDLAKAYKLDYETEYCEITHPAAILRAEVVRQDLMYNKAVVILENEMREI